MVWNLVIARIQEKTRKHHNIPYCTILVSITLIVVYLVYSENPQYQILIIENFAFVPLQFSLRSGSNIYRLLTANLLHFNFGHLIGNVVLFIIVGRRIERAVGNVAFFSAFFGLGALSFLGSWIISPSSSTRIIGSSGTISFMLGAYIILFPRKKILLLPFQKWFYVPFWVLSLVWIIDQVYMAVIVGEGATGIAYWTHIMGFVIGASAAAAWREFGIDTQNRIERTGYLE